MDGEGAAKADAGGGVVDRVAGGVLEVSIGTVDGGGVEGGLPGGIQCASPGYGTRTGAFAAAE
jgi:hypothetical protein